LNVPAEPKLFELGNWVDGVWVCKLVWRRNLFEWEKDLESELLPELQGLRLELELEDCWVWKDSECSSYSANSAYVFLRGEFEGGNSSMYENFRRLKLCLRPKSLLGGC